MTDRGQTALPAVAVALLVLTIVTGLGLAMADGALAAEQRAADERHLAGALSDRFVAQTSPLTDRQNVLNASRVAAFDDDALAGQLPEGADPHAVRLRVNGSTVARTGQPTDATTVRRIVLVRSETERTLTPSFGSTAATTLPRRTDRATVTISPPPDTTVRTVRANDRVVLHDPGGLVGSYELTLSRYATTRLRFAAAGPLPEGSVSITYGAGVTRKTTLAVTVDA